MTNQKLRGLHIVFLIISIPYAFLSWLMGIVPGVYHSLPYHLNLFAIAAYDLSALIGIIVATKQGVDKNPDKLNFWLLLPWLFFAIGIACLIILLKNY